MAKYRYDGDQPRFFNDIPDPDGNGTWVAQPGDTIDLNLDPIPVLDEDGNPTGDTRSPIDWLTPVTPKKPAAKTTTESKEQ